MGGAKGNEATTGATLPRAGATRAATVPTVEACASPLVLLLELLGARLEGRVSTFAFRVSLKGIQYKTRD